MTTARELRGPRVINARGNSTKAGGSVLHPDVIEAMAEAARYFVRIEDLQERAGAILARATHAEAAYVTPGAAAGLAMAAAAAIARLDPARMNRLPDTTGMPNEIVMLRRHRNDYDHLLRVAGAKLVEVGFAEWPFPYEFEAAIGPNTAALFYLGHDPVPNLPLSDVIAIAHAHDLPVIVDASVALPPAENLHALIDQGADLVAFSGGKHILGPQASGILAGRKDLILSVALQHQDMDVYPDTWPWRHLLEEGVLSGPPHHGMGRGFKVAKEEIAGLVVAVERYLQRDFAAEAAQWRRDLETIERGIEGMPGIQDARIVERRAGQPMLEVEMEPAGGTTAAALVNGLQSRDPLICTFEGGTPKGVVGFLPQSLLPGDAEEIVVAIREVVLQPARVG